jgi:serine/threonine-protein kinase RIO1
MRFFQTILIVMIAGFSTMTLADTTSSGATTNDQTNTSGSNTTITGGYSAENTTTYQSGSTNDTTSTTTNTTNNNNNSKVPVPTASAPGMSAYSQDICAVGKSGGIQLPGVGITGGTTARDMNCERMKLSKLLNDYGMKVAAVAILCQDPRVFEAMEQAGTPCPFEGKIGGAAVKQWKKYDIERPDYDRYVEKMDDRLKIDERIAKDEGTLAENESLKTNIKEVGKENTQLQKDIAELKKAQEELIAAQEAEIKRLEAIVALEEEEARLLREEAEAQREMEEAEAWANAELDRLEALANGEILVEELPPVEATDEVLVEETEDGRVKLTIPVTPGR